MNADVVIVGAGPTGLMLASELCLAGVRPLVLEKEPVLDEIPKANGFSGQILDLLRYRGLLKRVEEVSVGPVHTAPRLPFGGVHLDFSALADPPIWGVYVPQPRLERLLEDHARGLGAEVRRGHEVVGVGQDGNTVTVDVQGPEERYELSAAYLVGCDGPHSKVREAAGISFPGTTYQEVNRLGQVTLPESTVQLDDGDLDVPGLGRVRRGFTRTQAGVFGFGELSPGVLLMQTTEAEPAEADDDRPLLLAEFQDSIRRVLGVYFPFAEVIRLSRYRFQARLAERFCDGRLLLAGDAAHQFPATGIGINVGMLDAVNLGWKLAAAVEGWAPNGLLGTYDNERRHAAERSLLHAQAQVALRRGQDPAADALRQLFKEVLGDEQPLRRVGSLIAGTDICYAMPNPNQHPLTGMFAPDLSFHSGQGTLKVSDVMHSARPVLLSLAERAEFLEAVRDWQHRIEIHTGRTEVRSADALLIRPDAHVAWAAMIDEPASSAVPALRDALYSWFGAPVNDGALGVL